MNAFDLELQSRLDALRARHLHRALRRIDSPQGREIQVDGQRLINFSSNDYLGLADDPQLKHAAVEAVERFGAGSGASRLVCGSLAPFHQLEEALAAFKRTEAALTFATGFAAAIGTLPAVVDRNDIIILDKLVHASIVDAAKLSGARMRVFAHNDLGDLESKLRWASSQSGVSVRPRVLIATESVFSMDGDAAPLKEIVALKENYGAWLMVDEAHATGVCGNGGRGWADAQGVSEFIEIQMGTLGKALGASGGFVCGSRTLIDYLVNRARSFVFSTAPVPAAAAAALAGLKIASSSRGDTIRARLSQLKDGFSKRDSKMPAAITPVMVGDETAALNLATALRDRGFFVPAIRYPTVARGAARLRVTFTATHKDDDVERLASALAELAHPLHTA